MQVPGELVLGSAAEGEQVAPELRAMCMRCLEGALLSVEQVAVLRRWQVNGVCRKIRALRRAVSAACLFVRAGCARPTPGASIAVPAFAAGERTTGPIAAVARSRGIARIAGDRGVSAVAAAAEATAAGI